MKKHLLYLSLCAVVALDASAALADSTQDHHCRMPDKTLDTTKTHKQCSAAKGEWAKDTTPAATGATPANTQDHHCRLTDGSVDASKTHKQCTAAKGEWAKDAAAPATHTP